MVSYGQQTFLISLPLCTLLGAAVGFGFAFLTVGRKRTASLLLLTTAICGTLVVAGMWIVQIADYGGDPAERVLFWPPMAISVIAALGGIALRLSVSRKATRPDRAT